MATKEINWGTVGCYDLAARTSSASISSKTNTSFNVYSEASSGAYCWRKLYIDLATVFGTTEVTINKMTIKYTTYHAKKTLMTKADTGTGWSVHTTPNIVNSHKFNNDGTSSSWTDTIAGNLFQRFTYDNKECIAVNILVKHNAAVYTMTYQVTNISIVVDYTIPTYTLAVNATTGGTVIGGGSYESGKTATLTATPNNGYKFVSWSDGNTNATRTVTVTGNATYTAYFEPIPYIIYDSIFSFKKWKDAGILSASGIDISGITDIGFTAVATVDDAYTAECMVIPVKRGTEYTIEFDITGGNYELFVFNLASANIGSWGNSTPPFTMYGNTNKFNFTAVTDYISFRCDAVGTGTVVNFSNFRIYPAEYDYMANSVPANERTDTDGWSMPTPTREGYTFLGWFTEPIGGTQYNGNSAFPTTDLVLYSQWKKIDISKVYCGTKKVSVYCGTKKVSVYCGTVKIS